MINYEKSLKIAKKLNLNASHASLFTNVFDSLTTPLGLSGSQTSKNMFNASLKTGLNVLQSVTGTSRAADFIKADDKNSIRLLFPSLDFGYSYDPAARGDLYEFFDTGTNNTIMEQRPLAKGQLLPHIRLSEP